MEWVACNKEVVEWLGPHLGLGLGLGLGPGPGLELERGVRQAVAVGQLDEVAQELTAGYVCQVHYQFFLDLGDKVKISPHWTVNGLSKMILSEQVEPWLILSESQLALACLSKFVQTYVPAQAT